MFCEADKRNSIAYRDPATLFPFSILSAVGTRHTHTHGQPAWKRT